MRFGLKDEDIAAINAVFARYPVIDKVVLYGSRAKGNYKLGSDIDLTIIENGLTFDEFLQLERQLDDLLLPYTFDLSLHRKLDHPELLAHIQRIGVPFYERCDCSNEAKVGESLPANNFTRESPRMGTALIFSGLRPSLITKK